MRRNDARRRPLGSHPRDHQGGLLERKDFQPLRSQRVLPLPHRTPHRDASGRGQQTSQFTGHGWLAGVRWLTSVRWLTGHRRFTRCKEPDPAQTPTAERERSSCVQPAHALPFLPSTKAWSDSNELDARNQRRQRGRMPRHVPDQSHTSRPLGEAQECGDLHRRRRSRRLEVRSVVLRASGRGPQIAESALDREAVATVGASQRSLDHPPVLQAVGQEDQAELRPAAGTSQAVRKQKVHG